MEFLFFLPAQYCSNIFCRYTEMYNIFEIEIESVTEERLKIFLKIKYEGEYGFGCEGTGQWRREFNRELQNSN